MKIMDEQPYSFDQDQIVDQERPKSDFQHIRKNSNQAYRPNSYLDERPPLQRMG